MSSEKFNQNGLFGWLKSFFVGVSKPKEVFPTQESKIVSILPKHENVIEPKKTDNQPQIENTFDPFNWYVENPAGYEVTPKTGKVLGNMKPLDYNFKKDALWKQKTIIKQPKDL